MFLHGGIEVLTHIFFTQGSLYTREILHTDAFAHRSFYKQKLFHTEVFTPFFNTQRRLHGEVFTLRNRSTLWHCKDYLISDVRPSFRAKGLHLTCQNRSFDIRPSFHARGLHLTLESHHFFIFFTIRPSFISCETVKFDIKKS